MATQIRKDHPIKLERGITFYPALALVVGSVVGSGIFVSAPSMARALGSAPLLMLTWAVAVLSLATVRSRKTLA